MMMGILGHYQDHRGKYFDRLLEVGGPGYDEGFSKTPGDDRVT